MADMQSLPWSKGAGKRRLQFAVRRNPCIVGRKRGGEVHLDEDSLWDLQQRFRQIFIDGEEKSITSPAIAKNYGIGIVHQELMLAPDLTVAENIFLGREPKRWGLLDWRTMKEDAASLLQELRFSLSPSALVQDLTVAQKQLVEIAKVMSQKPRILIMDEPTSALTDSEVEHLFDRLETLRQTGIGIIYISHKMDEVKRIADRVTVLRDGHFIGTLEKAKLTFRP